MRSHFLDRCRALFKPRSAQVGVCREPFPTFQALRRPSFCFVPATPMPPHHNRPSGQKDKRMKTDTLTLNDAQKALRAEFEPALGRLLDCMQLHGTDGGAGEVMARLLVGLVADHAYPFPLPELAKLDRGNRAAALAVISVGAIEPWPVERAIELRYGHWTKLAERLPKRKR